MNPSRIDTNENDLPWSNRPFAELLRLAWPIAVSMLSFSAMSLVDTLFVGRISAAAIAGVGLASLLIFTLACFGIGMARSVKTLVAQAVGGGRAESSTRFLGAGLALALATSTVAIALGGLVLWALPALAGDPEAAREGGAYFEVRLWSIPLLLLYSATREYSYGRGNSRAPMVASLVANGANALLDYLLIIEVDLGAAGAAWASLIAGLLELGFVWYAIGPRFRSLRPSRRHIAELWRLGLPTGLQFVIEVGSFTLTGLIIAGISKLEMAGHQIALHALHLSFLPAHAIGEAGAVLAGQAIGAGRLGLIPRVARSTLLTATVYTSACTLAVLLLADRFGYWFTDDLRVASIAGVLLLFSASFQIVDGAAIVAGSLLRGIGDVRFVAYVSVIVAWACTPTGTYLLGVRAGLGALGAWIGITAELAVIAALFWWRLAGGRWQGAALSTRKAATE
ncbi:MAG: MATE family efflux transporter [Deltaproteobacteria bacterium]|nr:MATE family efflux transporter [Deltaproteobacteria bacterium]